MGLLCCFKIQESGEPGHQHRKTFRMSKDDQKIYCALYKLQKPIETLEGLKNENSLYISHWEMLLHGKGNWKLNIIIVWVIVIMKK